MLINFQIQLCIKFFFVSFDFLKIAFLSQMNIRTKIPLFTSITVLVTILAITIYSVLDYRKRTLDSIESYRIEQTEIIKNQLKDNVNSAYKMLDKAYIKIEKRDSERFVKIEEFPSVLQHAVKNIGQITFGEAASGYIWLNEIDPPYTVIMHPIKPEMNGTVQRFYIEDTKQNVYESFEDVINEQKGEGFLEYDYYKPGTNERIPKLSFIKLYEPLGWVIGTGVYIDYIDKIVKSKTSELNDQTNTLVSIIVILGVILISIASVTLFYLGKRITDSIYSVRQKLFKMSKGQSVMPDKTDKSDEIGDMNKSLNDLIAGLNRYSEFASEIEKGHLDTGFSPLSNEDILGTSLLDMRESLKKARYEEGKRREENERRNRANEGYTMFGELMRKGSDDLHELSYSIISNMVSYIDVNQGGIFIVNDDDPDEIFLELASSIAYNRRKFNEKRINVGDSLIGACAFEKKKIYISNLPEDYAEVRSGLGTATPKSLLIVPLLMEDNLIGVIELASLKIIDEFDIEFVEKVSDSIAASLYATKINVKTSQLQRNYDLLVEEKNTTNDTLIEKEKEIKQLKRKISSMLEEKSILSIK